MIIVKKKEKDENMVSIRKKGEGDLGSMAISDFLALALLDIKKNITT